MNIKDETKEKTFEKFIERYKDIPFLMIYKTIDFSKNLGNAFDLLEDFNHLYPMTYNFENGTWESTVLIENEIKTGNAE